MSIEICSLTVLTPILQPLEAHKAVESHQHQGVSLPVVDKKVADLKKNLNTNLKRAKQTKAHLQQPEARPQKKLGPSDRKRNTSDEQQLQTAKKRKIAGADLQLARKRKASRDEPKEQKKIKVCCPSPLEVLTLIHHSKTAVDDDEEEDEPMPDAKGSRPHVPVTTTRPGATSGLFASLFPNRKPIPSVSNRNKPCRSTLIVDRSARLRPSW